MTVAPGPVIEDFNVIEDIRPGQIPGFIYAFSDPFFFQQTEERFGHRIIPAVATPAHARRKVIGPAEALPVVTAVLAALIAMYEPRHPVFDATRPSSVRPARVRVREWASSTSQPRYGRRDR